MTTYNSTDNTDNKVVSVAFRDKAAFIRIGLPSEKIAYLDEARLSELDEALQTVERTPGIERLIISGANETMFCAGYNSVWVDDCRDEASARAWVNKAQSVLDRIESFSFVTIAAISGACCGAGFEIALRCKYRLISNRNSSHVGFPEVRLGFISGLGATQLVPRILSVDESIRFIADGDIVGPEEAADLGLVDLVVNVPQDTDVVAAMEKAAELLDISTVQRARKRFDFKSVLASKTSFGRSFLANQLRQKLQDLTLDKYQAPKRVLDAVLNGFERGFKQGLAYEADVFVELITSGECKSLLHLYFMSELSMRIGKGARRELQGASIGVIGDGNTWKGLVARLIMQGVNVTACNQDEKSRAELRAFIDEQLMTLSAQARAQLSRNLSINEQYDALKTCPLIIELSTDEFEQRKSRLKELSSLVDPKTVIAFVGVPSPLAFLLEGFDNLERFVGLNILPPVQATPIIELMGTVNTSGRALAYSAQIASLLGKYPVVINDVPGGLVYRLLAPFFSEACQLLSEGHSIEVVDDAMIDFGFSRGPFEMIDQIGLDDVAAINALMTESYGSRMAGPQYCKELANEGRLGMKSGSGFYTYADAEQLVDEKVPSILKLSWVDAKTSSTDVVDRLIYSLINEAVRSLDEGVSGDGGAESAGQIDLATNLALGFPSTLGGVLYYAEALGAPRVLARLNELMTKYGERFAPVKGIKLRGEKSASFYSRVKDLQ